MTLRKRRIGAARLPALASLCAALAACGGGSGTAPASTSPQPPAATTAIVDTVGNGGTIIDTLPTDAGVDASGNIYVADVNQQQVTRIAPDGTLTSYIAKSGATVQYALGAPGGLAVDPQGDVYVGSGDNVVEVTPSGQISTPYQLSTVYAALPNAYQDGRSGGQTPDQFAVDVSGNLYLTVTCSGIVRKIAPSGAMTTLASNLGIELNSFVIGGGEGSITQCVAGANGIAVDSFGNVYAADTLNKVILKITSAGTVTTLAGSPGASGLADGTGSSASFTAPGTLSVDENGNVYLIDQGLVRMISPQGVVKTLVGNSASKAAVVLPNATAPQESGAGAALAYGSNLYVFSGYTTYGWALLKFGNLLN